MVSVGLPIKDGKLLEMFMSEQRVHKKATPTSLAARLDTQCICQ
jgi:hypothetical protein